MKRVGIVIGTNFRWLGPDDKIVVDGFDDPKVQGVACHIARAQTGGVKGAMGVAEETGDASIACRQIGPIQFVGEIKAADPLRFADLSLAVIKLLGPGEYVLEAPDEAVSGHFGLAVKDYTRATAPNRRFPDLITQRVLRAALDGSSLPYSREESTELARNCTEKENDANMVERLVTKSAAAMLLSSRV